jgi:hypothetical protein
MPSQRERLDPLTLTRRQPLWCMILPARSRAHRSSKARPLAATDLHAMPGAFYFRDRALVARWASPLSGSRLEILFSFVSGAA